MTLGKASALAAAFIGVFAVGVAVGPSVMDRFPSRHARTVTEPASATTASASATDDTSHERTPATARRGAKAPTSTSATRTGARRPAAVSPVSPSEPRLHDRLKPVLNRGARMTVAAEGFRSGEEFAAVAHAARNTNVPFMVLKHRVVSEGQTLEEALHDARPEVDAKAEAARAQAAARSDVAAVAG